MALNKSDNNNISGKSDTFDAKHYLQRYNTLAVNDYRCVNRLMKLIDSGEYKGRLLDIGTGPVALVPLIASRTHSSIILSDCSPSCLAELKLWLDGNPGAYDWSLYSNLVSNHEGISAAEVESRARAAVKGVYECDIIKDPFLISCPDIGLFDVVTSFYCIDAAVKQEDDVRGAFRNVYSLLKPGGRFVMAVSLEMHCLTYWHDDPEQGETIHLFPLTLELVYKVMKEMGFRGIAHEEFQRPTELNKGTKGYTFSIFVSAMK